MKGPVLTRREGTLIPGPYDRTLAEGLVDSVAKNASAGNVGKIVVDTFGFNGADAAFIEAEVQRLRATTGIIIEVQ